MTWTYGNVDQSANPEEAAVWQDRVDAWPQIRAYKAAAAAALPDEGLVLDVGCGPGSDLVALGTARTVGVDASWTMCTRAAAARSGALSGDVLPGSGRDESLVRARVVMADGHGLPFADDAFAGCRADRVLQHLVDPDAALAEMIRVTRPGGRVVLADADQESVVVHVPGVPLELVDRVKALRRDVGYRNGRLAGQLPARLRDHGLADVQVSVFPLLITNPDDAFGLPHWPKLWRDRGVATFSDDELTLWAEAITCARPSGLIYALLYFVHSATVV